MIYHVQKERFLEAATSFVAAFKMSEYNDQCFSSSEVRKNILAGAILNKMFNMLEKQGVDIETLQRFLFKETSPNPVDEFDEKSVPDSLNIRINLGVMQDYLKKDNPFVEEGNEPVIAHVDYAEYPLWDPRFVYKRWHNPRKAVSTLKDSSLAFKRAFPTIEELLEKEELISIKEISDTFCSEEVDCSIIILTFENKKAVIQLGGFYRDTIILEAGKFVKIIDFSKADYSRFNQKPSDFNKSCVLKNIEGIEKDFKKWDEIIEAQ